MFARIFAWQSINIGKCCCMSAYTHTHMHMRVNDLITYGFICAAVNAITQYMFYIVIAAVIKFMWVVKQ